MDLAPSDRPKALPPLPYDALTMAAVADEIREFRGGKVQEIRGADSEEFAMELYFRGAKGWLLFSSRAAFARVHFTQRRPENTQPPPTFISTLRARLLNARLARVVQVASDRILRLDFETPTGPHSLIAEIMGKHSNVILIEESARIVGAAKWISPNRSIRPILSGKEYTLPPVVREAPDLLEPLSPTDARVAVGGKFANSLGRLPETWEPQFVADHGGYPVSPAERGYIAYPRPTISVALDSYYREKAGQIVLMDAQRDLYGRMLRLLERRERTVGDLRQTLEAAEHAAEWQQQGEVILAWAYTLAPRAERLEAYDFEGEPIAIPLDPELSPAENADRLFTRARKAKNRADGVRESLERFEREVEDIRGYLIRLRSATPTDVAELRAEAERRKWLIAQLGPKKKEERPFGGRKIRETLSPSGFPVLWGETADANDFLTLRIARPSDLWFHGRGFTSAHVIIRTGGKPERVTKPDLEFAALIAARHSSQKHSRLVPIDYAARRYVRKTRGAATGSVIYDHEKTLHVTPKGDE